MKSQYSTCSCWKLQQCKQVTGIVESSSGRNIVTFFIRWITPAPSWVTVMVFVECTDIGSELLSSCITPFLKIINFKIFFLPTFRYNKMKSIFCLGSWNCQAYFCSNIGDFLSKGGTNCLKSLSICECYTIPSSVEEASLLQFHDVLFLSLIAPQVLLW